MQGNETDVRRAHRVKQLKDALADESEVHMRRLVRVLSAELPVEGLVRVASRLLREYERKGAT